MTIGASAAEPEELKKIMTMARRRRMYFALGVKGKDVALLADIKRKPKALRKEVRGLVAGSPKGCSGEMALEAKVLSLFCIEPEVPEAIGKLATRYLRDNGLQIRVEILPGGAQEPSDDDADETGEGTADEDAKPDVRPKLMKAFAALKPEVARLLKVSNPDQQKVLRRLIDTFGAEIKGDTPERAANTLKQLRDATLAIEKRRQAGRHNRQGRLGEIRQRAASLRERLNGVRSRTEARA